MPLAQAVEGVWEQWWWWPALEKEGGRRGRQVGDCETGSGGCRGLGALGSGLWAEGSKEEVKSEQGSGDLVLGGCGPEWAKCI